jgi:hemerythrin-like metal-binding protein
MPQAVTLQPIEWEVSMATGIDEIDQQHHYLVETLRELNEKLLDDESNMPLGQVSKDLLGYALMHFETEEALMLRYDYVAVCPPEAQRHIAQHRDFSRRVLALRDQLREGEMISRIELLRYLNDWLRNHILGTDQLLGKFLIKKWDKCLVPISKALADYLGR